jgi:hypothetical protein
MKKNFCIFLILLILHQNVSVNSQELNCNISINSSAITNVDQSIFDNLQSSIYEFMNARKWTNYNFEPEERIVCSIIITINSYVIVNMFGGTFQVQLRRPVYNTSYHSTLFNFQDKDIQFQYTLGTSLDYIENTFVGNLESLLAYYAYLFIGLDFDSFQELGGNPFYEKAWSVINSIPANATQYKGWRSYENQRNRYWILENLTNKSYDNYRKGFYLYHRHGLDIMVDDIVKGRSNIIQAMKLIQQAYKEKPGLFIINLFMTAKSDELVNIFKPAPTMEKTEIVNILKSIDPMNASKYNEILVSQ